MSETAVEPRVVAPGEGVHGTDAGPMLPTFEVKLGADAGLGFSVVESVVPPRFSPPPVTHRQTREDCAVYVLEGELRYWFDGGDAVATTGSLVQIPRLSWWRWANERDEPCRMLAMFRPAGFEQYFLDLGAAVVAAGDDHAAFVQTIGRLREQYGDEERAG